MPYIATTTSRVAARWRCRCSSHSAAPASADGSSCDAAAHHRPCRTNTVPHSRPVSTAIAQMNSIIRRTRRPCSAVSATGGVIGIAAAGGTVMVFAAGSGGGAGTAGGTARK